MKADMCGNAEVEPVKAALNIDPPQGY